MGCASSKSDTVLSPPYPSPATSAQVETEITSLPLKDQGAARTLWALTISRKRLNHLRFSMHNTTPNSLPDSDPTMPLFLDAKKSASEQYIKVETERFMIKLDAQNLESRESKAPENALPVYEPGSMSADELKHQTKSDAKLHRERETARREKYAAIIRLIDTV